MSATPAIDRILSGQIDALQAENTKLKNALQQGDKAEAPYTRLLEKYERLKQAYLGLEESHAKCKPYVDRATEKYRAAKESARQWQQFYDRQKQKAERLREASDHVNRASIAVLDVLDPERTPRPLSTRHRPELGEDSFEENDQSEDVLDHESHTADERVGNETEQPIEAELEPDQSHEEQSSETLGARARRVTSSQTTEYGSDPPVPYGTRLGSDDEPQFVSARPVKRRRGNSPRAARVTTQVKQEATSPTQPQEINSEDFSSPVLKRHRPLRRETSNLDATVENLDSPGKRRERRAVSADVMRPPRMPATTSSLSEGDVLDSYYQTAKEESRSLAATTDQGVTTRDFALPPEGSDVSERALQPMSVNITRTMPRPRASETKRKRRNEETRGKAAIVSEDGDMDSSQVHPEERKDAPDAAVSRRLGSLLDEPTPGRQQIARRVVPQANPLHRREQFAAPEIRNTKNTRKPLPTKQLVEARPVFKTPNAASTSALATPTNASVRLQRKRSPPPPDPEEEPLRARPVFRLNIEDFRVSPKYGGTDFAFADTLRGRDQRRCLPGCTKPECCGDAFRKAAEMGVKGKRSDAECLENYLGPNYESHMASRPSAERDDILVKARTYAIASEYGKHRQAFKRHNTPPGFWRIDMPSTQEEEQDRIKAKEMVRQEVYDRWREAMVPGGRWKFRDE